MSNLLIADLARALQTFPEFMRARDLINLGLFAGRADVCVARQRGESPPIHRNLDS